jgi:hypothetical protein
MRNASLRIRERLSEVTPGPWTAGPFLQGLRDVFGPKSEKVCQSGVDWPCTEGPDAEWIALMSPSIAESLIRVLDVCADEAERFQRLEVEHEAALVLAREINSAAKRERRH